MQTICDLKIELKKRGIKGISGLNKSQLVALLASGKSQPKKETPKEPQAKPTPPPKPLLLKMEEEPIPMIGIKITVLRRLQVSLGKLIKDKNVFKGEKDNAIHKLKLVKAAIAAKTKKK
jgi:hypothetical protein